MKGSRKFQCDECKTIRFVNSMERVRAAKPRCMNCGSTRLEPVSEGAKQESPSLNNLLNNRKA